ncbi:hypothetical protein CRV01_06070 [Arcobacter sp. CECT 8983]|uniref:type II toxin-antitoxin system PemK/MazF family toxin n=1 Tax=Arcobacter sp. CECT 8983 TaxID=2044508 RepID=UPI00100B1ED6|nr:type II toxin-antitoxin system PemK/MazF family toxin [Arcobacter sp. CECT 8983]RXJ90714.1 hypothetical protein CRV01_06070 [Arcobacter sp. CECT 8983]
METTNETFDQWNRIKRTTNQNNRKLGIKPREIYWAKIGQNIGYEQNGKGSNFARPVLIIRKLTSELFIAVPLTSTLKNNDYFHRFKYINKQNGEVENSALILQLRVFSIKRLMNKAGVINKKDFHFVIKKCTNLISPT